MTFLSKGEIHMNNMNLYEAYLRTWNNRNQESNKQPSKNKLKEAVLIELHDEMTHPRTRKAKETKFYYAVNRILNSTLNEEEKIALIQFYLKVMEEISH